MNKRWLRFTFFKLNRTQKLSNMLKVQLTFTSEYILKGIYGMKAKNAHEDIKYLSINIH